MGFSKLQTQFLFLIGVVLFLTLVLNLMPFYHEVNKNVLRAINVPLYGASRNNSPLLTFKKDLHRNTGNIWKIVPGEDNIQAQIAFNPTVKLNLTAKKILLEHGVAGWGVKHGKATFAGHHCIVQNCELVSTPEVGAKYDARMFKEIDLNNMVLEELRSETLRHTEQVWIMFGLESPQASPDYDGLNNVINWTATYRHQSTIVTPYDKWAPYRNFTSLNGLNTTRNYAKGKSKLGAIFISNCNAANNRLEYINELKTYMTVDVYGYCGDMECSKISQLSCFERLQKDYKFYFSFENANCRDYITEKFFMNALRYDIVPVVMGAHPDDYKRVAPPGSYIHVEEFSGPKELASYLQNVANNDAAYNKYFRWKDTGLFIDTKFWCRICSMLWDPEKPRRSVADLNQWWRGEGVCIDTRRWDSLKTDNI